MSRIQWTDETWNPTVGCSLVSPGCTNCYAMKTAHRGLRPEHRGLTRQTKGGPVWNGTVRLLPERLEQPLRWRKPRRVFVDSMGDLFHPDVPFEFVDRVLNVAERTAGLHTYQILTKHPERLREYVFSDPYRERAMPRHWNVWLGTSVEDQARADERIPPLLQTPAALRFLSVEPLLGPVDLQGPGKGGWLPDYPSQPGWREGDCRSAIDWIIVGGESGPSARPCNVEWIRDVVRQCREAQVPCFVKQLGKRPMENGACLRVPGLHDAKGGDPDEWPEDLRVREEPQR